MKNVDLIKRFRNGATSGRCGNLEIDGDNLINYSTVIAKRVGDGIILNNRKYSRTTSVIQNTIKNECNVVGEYVGEVAYIG